MPLIYSKIEDGVRNIVCSTNNSNFGGFPTDNNSMAEKWSLAVNEYAKKVVPISTTSSVAKQAFYNEMLNTSLGAVNFWIVLQTAFQKYAVSLASGMTGAGFVGTPPPSLIPIPTVMGIALVSGDEVLATTMAGIIHTWFKTGTATPLSGGSPINWS